MQSRLWFKAFFFTFALVASCTIVFTLSTIVTLRDTTTTLEVRNARNALDHVYRLVQAKHQEIESFREQALKAKKEQLKNIIQVVDGYLLSLQAKVERGELSKEEAQTIAIDQVRNFKYGNGDYIFICNFEYITIAHPDPKRVGADDSKILDVKGYPIIPPIVDVARINGEGFTSYWWNRLGQRIPSEKLTFSSLFEPWGWVCATGVYIDDIEMEVSLRKKALIAELKALMSTITLGKTGYMFIFDNDFNMIIHPDSKLEGANFRDLKDPASGLPLGQKLKKTADEGHESLKYMWENPEDIGNFRYEKISWVKRFDPFDWYLASSMYVEELHQASRMLTYRTLVSSALVLLVFSVLAALLIRRFMKPVERLSAVAVRVGQGELDERSGVRGNDEIGVLGREFDQMVDNLQGHVRNLDAKVREKTEELRHKNESLEEANRQVRDSLDYASRIQAAILPPMGKPLPGVGDMFAIWRPKDVIGGDFHWIRPMEGGFFAAMVDCTGHGVPGAVMTMIANMALSQAVSGASLEDPSSVLERLDANIRSVLGQNGGTQNIPSDGLEIGLVGVNQSSGQLHYAGGGVDLYMEDGGEVVCIRADRREIGGRVSKNQNCFTNHSFTLDPSAWIYLFSDGFIEQSGGEKEFPLGRTRVMEILKKCLNLPAEGRKSVLLRELSDYMKDQEQRDDITVLGLSIQPQPGAEHA